MQDMTEDGYRTMICLESANAREDRRLLYPGEMHILKAQISQENIV